MDALLNIGLSFFVFILLFNSGYLLFFAIVGIFPQRPPSYTLKKLNKFAVFIPAYKGDEVILHTAEESLKQNYPEDLFDVIIIADSLKPQTIEKLCALPIKVVEVQFENSTKGKALNAAIDALQNVHYDYAIILDIDNLMQAEFLSKLNERLQAGQQVLQAHRLAKNEDTNFSVLDAISEEINNHIFRKAHKALGLSSALIGSGKAMAYPLFVEIMREIKAIGGFDKEMEILLISRLIKIDYAHDLLVFDEKVQLPEVFQNQRRRWMSAQLTFMRKYALKGIIVSIRTLNIDYLDKSLQLLLLPRVLNLGLSALFCFTWFFNLPYGNLFLIVFAFQFFALVLATPLKYYNLRTLKALAFLPQGFALMFLNLFKLKGANKKFIHTPHSTVNSNDSKKSI
jgi:cellulose synthase/poly-beta-1,6-N-acetylglucosamine synthase-like glycosyltransferase